MARYVDIKAEVRDLECILEKVKGISTSDSVLLEQEDVFYQTFNGRLKLRNEKGQVSHLIYYQRPDVKGPTLCNYDKCLINENDASGLKSVLAQALGERGIVRKKRLLFMVGQTRIHIDNVEGLGNFLELEVHLDEHQSPEEGKKIAESLMDKLGIQKDELLCGAYVDLLAKK